MNPFLLLDEKERRQPHTKISIPNWWSGGLPAELEEFYATYVAGAGWIGKSYISIFSLNEIDGINERWYEDDRWRRYFLFASDGAGERFGFYKPDDRFAYVLAPCIGGFADVLELGYVESFFMRMKNGRLFG